jgi:VWFA-related protein
LACASVRFILCILLLLTALPLTGAAQETDPQLLSDILNVLPSTGPTISTRVDEVNLAFTVTDKKGRFIDDLTPQDFTLLDNRLPPRKLEDFRQQTDLPLRVAVLIDISDSVKYRFKFEQYAARLFLKKILRPGRDQAMVAAFGSRVRLLQGFTDDTRSLTRSVRNLTDGGDTALYDAIVFACAQMANSPPESRRAIILITDGEDTHSHALMHDAEQAALRCQVTLFALSTNDLEYGDYPRGEAVLDLLTTPTGGRILPARDESQLNRAFLHLEKALRNQYSVAYQPAAFAADGSFRKIDVTPVKHGLKVQYRRGYYARSEDYGYRP